MCTDTHNQNDSDYFDHEKASSSTAEKFFHEDPTFGVCDHADSKQQFMIYHIRTKDDEGVEVKDAERFTRKSLNHAGLLLLSWAFPPMTLLLLWPLCSCGCVRSTPIKLSSATARLSAYT